MTLGHARWRAAGQLFALLALLLAGALSIDWLLHRARAAAAVTAVRNARTHAIGGPGGPRVETHLARRNPPPHLQWRLERPAGSGAPAVVALEVGGPPPIERYRFQVEGRDVRPADEVTEALWRETVRAAGPPADE